MARALPRSLYRSIYPDFFPCAGWEYGQNMDAQYRRARFDCGWTRQRKPSREETASGTLSFTMSTKVFSRWARWMVSNGYDWFAMHLDRFYGELALYEIRLIAPIDYRYRSFDVVDVYVVAELGAQMFEFDSPPPPPSFGPETGEPGLPVPLPQCVPYSCSAYEEALIAQGIDFLPVYAPAGNLDWMFATVRGQDGLYHVWGGYTTSPVLNTGFGANVKEVTANWPWNTPVVQPSFCDGQIAKCITIDSSGSPVGITRRDFAEDLTEFSSWGHHAMSCIFTGKDGGSVVSGDFLRNTNAPFLYDGQFFGVSPNTYIIDPALYVSIVPDVTDYKLVVSVGGGAEGLDVAQVNIGPVGGRWSIFNCTVSPSVPIVEDDPEKPGRVRIKYEVAVTASVNGTSVTAVGYASVGNLLWATNVRPHDTQGAAQGVYFYIGNVTLAAFNAITTTEQVDAELIGIAYERNFADYEPPAWCDTSAGFGGP